MTALSVSEWTLHKASTTEAIELVVHVHLADSQRREPGSGHLDFAAVPRALADGHYSGAMAMEFLPATEQPLAKGRERIEALIP